MAKAKKTTYGVFKGKAYWAKIFKENMDDSEYHEKTNGQFNMIFIPDSEEVIDEMIKAGFPEVSMGNQMIKSYDFADGKRGMKLKRPNVHPSGYDNLGGAPVVTKGMTNEPWSYSSDGDIGNSSSVAVKISIYGEGSTASVKLERVGVIEHVPFVASAGASNNGW